MKKPWKDHLKCPIAKKFHPLSPQLLFDKASVNVLEVVGVEPTIHAIMLVLIAAALGAAAKVYLLEHFFRFAAAAAFSGASVRLFGLEVGSVLVELIKLVAGCLNVSTNGCFIEAGFAVLSVEYFSAAGAAAALLLFACVVCVAAAAFQACAFPRVDVAEIPKDSMDLEKPECSFPVFVRTFSGTRTLYASSSMLVSDFILLVSQSAAVPETSFSTSRSRDSFLVVTRSGRGWNWERRFSGHE